MKIIEQIKWGKLRKYIWDKELDQTSGEVTYNNPTEGYIFSPDDCSFDDKQLNKIAKLLKKLNDAEQKDGE